MKHKALKITESTLFVYKQADQNTNRPETDTTSVATTTTATTGVFPNKGRG